MTRVVLLNFPKNVDAEDFVRAICDPETKIADMLLFGSIDLSGVTVEAVVARPGRKFFCKCAQEGLAPADEGIEPEGLSREQARRWRSKQRRRNKSAQSRGGGWFRGNHYGWWLCSRCHKPSRLVVRHFGSALIGGNNDLLPEILGTGEPLNPHRRWERDGGTRNEYDAGLPVGDGQRVAV